jgi:hypothetical protein
LTQSYRHRLSRSRGNHYLHRQRNGDPTSRQLATNREVVADLFTCTLASSRDHLACLFESERGIRTRNFKIAPINSSQVFQAGLVAASLETGGSQPLVTQAHSTAFGDPTLYESEFPHHSHTAVHSQHEEAQNTASRLRSASVIQAPWPLVRQSSIFAPSNPGTPQTRARRPVPRSAISNPNLRYQQQNMRYVLCKRSFVAY